MRFRPSPGAGARTSRPRPGRTPARTLVIAVALAAGLGAVHAAQAARINGIGLIDYKRKDYKVGDWVRYRIESSTSEGREDVNFQEIRIVGREDFRGEPCIWVETTFGRDTVHAASELVLVSERAFDDPDADVRFAMYLRLMMFGSDDQGIPEMIEVQRSNPDAPMPDLRPLHGTPDTVGTETIETRRGRMNALLVRLERKLRNSRDTADSTVNRITATERRMWYARTVPITSLVREEETTEYREQAYRVGTVSTDAPERVVGWRHHRASVETWGTGARSDALQLWRSERGLLTPPVQAGARR